MADMRRVVLLLYPHAGYDRAFLQGVVRYARVHGPWIFYLAGEDSGLPLPETEAVSGGSFTEVSCMGMPSIRHELQPQNNRYKNPFGTEIALLRTSEGGMSRMAIGWDIPGSSGEVGRVRGERGTMIGMSYNGAEKKLPDLGFPPLPPTVSPGGHGGSHGHLMNEFVTAILEDRKPYPDIVLALNMTVAGTVAHQSALKDGENMKIPQYA